MDSVFAYAHALDTMCRQICPNITCGKCIQDRNFDHDALLESLLDTRFTSLANGLVSFMENGDSTGRYSIKQFQETASGSGKYEFLSVGTWGNGEDHRDVISGSTPWYLRKTFPRDKATGTPLAVCSLPCGPGEKKLLNPDIPCCWRCVRCGDTEIVINGVECYSCIDEDIGSYGWPDDYNRTKCVAIEPEENDWSTAIISVSTLGIIITVIVTCLYVYNRNTPLIKASSRELSYVMFTGKCQIC